MLRLRLVLSLCVIACCLLSCFSWCVVKYYLYIYIYICVVAMRGVAIVRVSCCSQFVVMLATDRTQLAGRCA